MTQPIEIFTSDSDAWDDSALIKAWDVAHESFKKELLEGNGKDDALNNSHITIPKRKRKNKKKKNKVTENHKSWLVGERCEAKYAEDGLFYTADIVALSETFATVCFIEYGDEDDVMLADLRKMKPDQSPGNMKAPPVFDSSNGFVAPPLSSNGFVPPPPLPMWNQMYPSPSTSQLMPPPPCPIHHNKNNVPSAHSNHSHGPIPQPSCPPHPFSSSSCSDEAIANMLMSWYKTGYSTGYYQALREHNIIPNSKDSKKVPDLVESMMQL